jgi:hypothetical protein
VVFEKLVQILVCSAALRKESPRSLAERTNSWQNAHKKLVLCTERRGRVIDFWVALSLRWSSS